MAEKSAARIY